MTQSVQAPRAPNRQLMAIGTNFAIEDGHDDESEAPEPSVIENTPRRVSVTEQESFLRNIKVSFEILPS